MSTQPLPINQFAKNVRDKYPGAYDSMSDADLVQKIVTKFPQYKQNIDSYAQTQFEKQRTPSAGSGGFWNGVKHAAGFDAPQPTIKDALEGGIPAIGAAKSLYGAVKNAPANFKAGGPAGVVGPLVGVDPVSMRDRAEHGDTNGILGEAAVPAAMALSPMGAEAAGKGFRGARAGIGDFIHEPETGNLTPGVKATSQVLGGATGATYGALHRNPYAAITGGAAGYKLAPTIVDKVFAESPIRKVQRFGDQMENDFGPQLGSPENPGFSAKLPTRMPKISKPSGEDLQGNPSLFEPDSQDLISRMKKIAIPGEAPTAADLKRAGDFTQVPLSRLQTLKKFGDKLAENEINRRVRNK